MTLRSINTRQYIDEDGNYVIKHEKHPKITEIRIEKESGEIVLERLIKTNLRDPLNRATLNISDKNELTMKREDLIEKKATTVRIGEDHSFSVSKVDTETGSEAVMEIKENFDIEFRHPSGSLIRLDSSGDVIIKPSGSGTVRTG
jgi:hypothetical protein